MGLPDPIFFLQISFSWVEIRLQVEFHPPGLPRSGSSMVGDNKKQKTKFHEINGFLSLQLGLSFELGFRLRLTKRLIVVNRLICYGVRTCCMLVV